MFEYLIVAVLVLWSAVVVFKKVFPQTASSAFLALSNQCQRLGWQRLAVWLKPKMAVGCGGGCGCSTDDAESKKTETVQTVKWR
ncbi:hypothetical protein F993_03138 [Acinetobacter proteolyticus]|jgi:hypothetical protein|uniref:Uncharacterized protein n=1 Tax=Acinetobacter proteolyticus TaxID=1776741 RepID=A0A653K733_9GAMM|nr:DUF6587 family protein [Acinetobacter proteolyticus]ENU22245.1 hypothetical protein F993_03138 [Acinetobacter proteolyticus]OEY96531.1 hypothetical protein BJD20_00470 [Acinetobacter proteolyticus]PKF35161.1 hypothetical protein CW311_05110 [Acinetobacter proteolyticus]WEI19194.1 hypothetical protein PY247_03810 [Acinetobacter proteolyticus]VXA56424.1 conserved hypothetical protein [Acinetobacter proteolyticus]